MSVIKCSPIEHDKVLQLKEKGVDTAELVENGAIHVRVDEAIDTGAVTEYNSNGSVKTVKYIESEEKQNVKKGIKQLDEGTHYLDADNIEIKDKVDSLKSEVETLSNLDSIDDTKIQASEELKPTPEVEETEVPKETEEKTDEEKINDEYLKASNEIAQDTDNVEPITHAQDDRERLANGKAKLKMQIDSSEGLPKGMSEPRSFKEYADKLYEELTDQLSDLNSISVGRGEWDYIPDGADPLLNEFDRMDLNEAESNLIGKYYSEGSDPEILHRAGRSYKIENIIKLERILKDTEGNPIKYEGSTKSMTESEKFAIVTDSGGYVYTKPVNEILQNSGGIYDPTPKSRFGNRDNALEKTLDESALPEYLSESDIADITNDAKENIIPNSILNKATYAPKGKKMISTCEKVLELLDPKYKSMNRNKLIMAQVKRDSMGYSKQLIPLNAESLINDTTELTKEQMSIALGRSRKIAKFLKNNPIYHRNEIDVKDTAISNINKSLNELRTNRLSKLYKDAIPEYSLYEAVMTNDIKNSRFENNTELLTKYQKAFSSPGFQKYINDAMEGARKKAEGVVETYQDEMFKLNSQVKNEKTTYANLTQPSIEYESPEHGVLQANLTYHHDTVLAELNYMKLDVKSKAKDSHIVFKEKMKNVKNELAETMGKINSDTKESKQIIDKKISDITKVLSKNVDESMGLVTDNKSSTVEIHKRMSKAITNRTILMTTLINSVKENCKNGSTFNSNMHDYIIMKNMYDDIGAKNIAYTNALEKYRTKLSNNIGNNKDREIALAHLNSAIDNHYTQTNKAFNEMTGLIDKYKTKSKDLLKDDFKQGRRGIMDTSESKATITARHNSDLAEAYVGSYDTQNMKSTLAKGFEQYKDDPKLREFIGLKKVSRNKTKVLTELKKIENRMKGDSYTFDRLNDDGTTSPFTLKKDDIDKIKSEINTITKQSFVTKFEDDIIAKGSAHDIMTYKLGEFFNEDRIFKIINSEDKGGIEELSKVPMDVYGSVDTILGEENFKKYNRNYHTQLLNYKTYNDTANLIVNKILEKDQAIKGMNIALNGVFGEIEGFNSENIKDLVNEAVSETMGYRKHLEGQIKQSAMRKRGLSKSYSMLASHKYLERVEKTLGADLNLEPYTEFTSSFAAEKDSAGFRRNLILKNEDEKQRIMSNELSKLDTANMTPEELKKAKAKISKNSYAYKKANENIKQIKEEYTKSVKNKPRIAAKDRLTAAQLHSRIEDEISKDIEVPNKIRDLNKELTSEPLSKDIMFDGIMNEDVLDSLSPEVSDIIESTPSLKKALSDLDNAMKNNTITEDIPSVNVMETYLKSEGVDPQYTKLNDSILDIRMDEIRKNAIDETEKVKQIEDINRLKDHIQVINTFAKFNKEIKYGIDDPAPVISFIYKLENVIVEDEHGNSIKTNEFKYNKYKKVTAFEPILNLREKDREAVTKKLNALDDYLSEHNLEFKKLTPGQIAEAKEKMDAKSKEFLLGKQEKDTMDYDELYNEYEEGLKQDVERLDNENGYC